MHLNCCVIVAAGALGLIGCGSDSVMLPHGKGSSGTAALHATVNAAQLGYGAPPPPRAFGPDSYSPKAYTGQGTTAVGVQCPVATPPVPMECTGFRQSAVDGTLLDVTVDVPKGLPTSGPYPLVALIHGYGGSKNGGGQYVNDLTARGYTVLRYSTRGFGESWGQVNLADLNLEIGDLRSMIGQVVDDPRFLASPSVAILGASYGGGHSWLAAIQPTFASPAGAAVTIRTIIPIVPWTDLLYALRPNGRASNSIDVAGFYKLSFLQGLFVGGIRKDAQRPYPNYPEYLGVWDGYILTSEPNTTDPVGTQIVDGLAGYRSIWWQQAFWDAVRAKAGTGTQLPVFELQGFTDDLFPLPEALRMYYALRSVDPGYPITLYLGDIGHPRAPNKVGEVSYAQQLIYRWLDYHLKGLGSPPTGVMAAITRPGTVPFNSGDVVAVASYGALATGEVTAKFHDTQVITFNPANASGFFVDPFVMLAAEALQPLPPAPPPDVIPGDVAVYSVPVATLTSNPSGLLIAGQPAVRVELATPSPREQLDVRIFDVTPSGQSYLVTRGTYALDAPDLPALIPLDVTVPTYGNLWQAGAGDVLRLEITNVDTPYLAPSKVPSVTTITRVQLVLPYR
ncbi:MAG: hypothetical protein NVS4B3_26380 [Gemmatimonadaceae bacterium]